MAENTGAVGPFFGMTPQTGNINVTMKMSGKYVSADCSAVKEIVARDHREASLEDCRQLR